MARGNGIIVSAEPKGRFIEGIVSGTPKPGTIMQIDPTVALVNGRHTWVVYNRDADSNRPLGPIAVLLEDYNQGRPATTAYASGEMIQVYCPLPGDELNCLVADIAGTGDDHTKGEIMIVDDGTGKLIATTGSPEIEPFVLLETLTDPSADQLAWVMFTGY